MKEKSKSSLQEFEVFKGEEEKSFLNWFLVGDFFFLITTLILMFVSENIFHMNILGWKQYWILFFGNLIFFLYFIFSLRRNFKIWLLKYVLATYAPLLIGGWIYFSDPAYVKVLFGAPIMMLAMIGFVFYDSKLLLAASVTIAIMFGFLFFHFSRIGSVFQLYEISLMYIFLLMGTILYFALIERTKVFLKELLGDEATIEWMQKWKAREAEATKMMLLSELSKAQADRLREAPERSEMDSNLDLRARLSELKTDELQLKYIAEQMTSLSSQPTVAALLDCCEMLKKKLLADSEKTDPVAAQAKALQGFYESLIPVRFLSGLDSDIVSPLRCEDSRVSFFQLPRASAHRASAEEDSLTIGSSGVERSVASADLDADIEMDDQSSVLNKPTQ